jgi:hypothetical protein
MGNADWGNRDHIGSVAFEASTIPLFSVLAVKTYLVSLFSIFALGILCIACILGVRYWVIRDINAHDERQGQLLKLQELKIRELLPDSIDTVLVGDSALGNAIDIRTFNQKTHLQSINLALTGSFGYGGGLALLRSLAERQTRMRNIVLFYSVDAMALGPLPEGYFFTTPAPDMSLPWRERFQLLRTYASRLLDGRAASDFLIRTMTGKLAGLSLPASVVEDDYVISRSVIALDNTKSYRIPRQIVPASIVFLEQVARLCRDKGWNCVYVNGPVLSNSVSASPWSDDYFANVKRAIEHIGIKVAGGPLLMAEQDRGDTVFHVRYDQRENFTSRYADLLREHLLLCNEGGC